MAAIELDDKSDDAASRSETDRKKERATEAAGIRLLRWHVKALPDNAAIQAAFAKSFGSPLATRLAGTKPSPESGRA